MPLLGHCLHWRTQEVGLRVGRSDVHRQTMLPHGCRSAGLACNTSWQVPGGVQVKPCETTVPLWQVQDLRLWSNLEVHGWAFLVADACAVGSMYRRT